MAETKPRMLIFGATSAIGSNLARKLHEQGAKLALTGRDEDAVRTLAEELDAKHFVCDATSFSEVEEAVNGAADALGGLDGVANCVGSLLLKPAHLTSEEEFAETIAINLNSAFFIMKAAVRPMMKTGGSLVFVSSVAACVGLSNHEAIAAAKGGIIGLTRSGAASYAPRGIRVNCVAPGLVESKMTAKLTEKDATRKVSEKMHPLGRIGQPEDIAGMMAMLLDPKSDWITGQVFNVDGGMSYVKPR